MIKISIVEDKDQIRNKIQECIEQSIPDMECKYTYENAEKAINGFILNKPEIIIMDIGLPDMNGIQ